MHQIFMCLHVTYKPQGHTKFTTSGAHDLIAITSPQNNDIYTEELHLHNYWTRSVYHLEKLDSVVYFYKVKKGHPGADSSIKFHLGRLF